MFVVFYYVAFAVSIIHLSSSNSTPIQREGFSATEARQRVMTDQLLTLRFGPGTRLEASEDPEGGRDEHAHARE